MYKSIAIVPFICAITPPLIYFLPPIILKLWCVAQFFTKFSYIIFCSYEIHGCWASVMWNEWMLGICYVHNNKILPIHVFLILVWILAYFSDYGLWSVVPLGTFSVSVFHFILAFKFSHLKIVHYAQQCKSWIFQERHILLELNYMSMNRRCEFLQKM